MSVTARQRLLFVFGQPCCTDSLAEEGLDALLVAASFEVDIDVVFFGPGVAHIVRPENVKYEKPSYAKTFNALADFGVEKLYVYGPSLSQRQLDISDMCVVVEAIEADRLTQLLHNATTVFSF